MSWGLAAIEPSPKSRSRGPFPPAFHLFSHPSTSSISPAQRLPAYIDPKIQPSRGRESATRRAVFVSQPRCSADFHMQGGRWLPRRVLAHLCKRRNPSAAQNSAFLHFPLNAETRRQSSLTTYIAHTQYREQLQRPKQKSDQLQPIEESNPHVNKNLKQRNGHR
jgi:hypothetical protein